MKTQELKKWGLQATCKKSSLLQGQHVAELLKLVLQSQLAARCLRLQRLRLLGDEVPSLHAIATEASRDVLQSLGGLSVVLGALGLANEVGKAAVAREVGERAKHERQGNALQDWHVRKAEDEKGNTRDTAAVLTVDRQHIEGRHLEVHVHGTARAAGGLGRWWRRRSGMALDVLGTQGRLGPARANEAHLLVHEAEDRGEGHERRQDASTRHDEGL